jgi:hypothetical protein
MRKKEIGVCRICSKKTELTFEHIPPQNAFNNFSAKAINGEEILKVMSEQDKMPWDLNGLRYEQKQRGMGLYSLCSDCNNSTGHFYVPEYLKFANTIDMFYSQHKINKNENFHFYVKDICPLRFAKQILSMFCSTDCTLSKIYPEITELILNKNKKGIDTLKFRLGMFLIKDRRIAYTGLNVIGNINGKLRVVSSIDAYPFGFTLDTKLQTTTEYKELDITSFLNDYEYTDVVEMEFSIPVHERNIMFPTDYRSKEEIEKQASEVKHNID